MKAMILAAGLGSRMRPLTNHTPKPLIKVSGKHLIEFHIERLMQCGVKEIVINTHWLAEQLPAALGDGAKWGVKIHYLNEEILLETAGGIQAALPFLSDGKQAFLVVNGDIYTELDLSSWIAKAPLLNEQCLAYLALVNNPDHNKKGDFSFEEKSSRVGLLPADLPAYTYAGLAIFHPNFFHGLKPGPSPLGPLLRTYIRKQNVYGACITDYWLDVGTPERLAKLKQRLIAGTKTSL